MAEEIVGGDVCACEILVEGTELSPEIQVGSITVENSLHAPDRAVFTIVNAISIPEEEILWIGLDFNLGDKIEIQLGYDDKTKTVFKGLITSQKANIYNDGVSGVKIIAHDHSFAMQRKKKSVWSKDIKVSEVLTGIASDYNLKAKIDDDGIKHNVIEQFEDNDFNFLCRLAKVNGIEFYVQSGTLHFKKPDYSQSAEAKITLGNTLLSFTGELDIADQTPEKAEKLASGNIVNWGECFTRARLECLGSPMILPGKNLELSGVGKVLSKRYYVERTVHNMSGGNYTTRSDARQMIKNA